MMKSLVKLLFVLQLIALSSSSTQDAVEESEAEALPNIWDDETVNRMVREVLARDLAKEHEIRLQKRLHKREVVSTVSPVENRARPTTRKAAPVTQKTKKPSKVTSTGNKNKNRVTPSTTTTKTTVIPSSRPIVSNSASNALVSAANSSQVKPNTQPTKYHYYPHHQQPYFLPECAIQQVCNAVYVRLNFTQPLCVCPPRYRDPCSLSLNEDDSHTITLVGNANKKAVTLAKTCEQVIELRDCRAPRDWSILALQNTRTGKSHYLVICKCPSNFRLEGPLPHDQPTYAGLPGINVYGMLCVPQSAPTKFNQWRISQRPVIHTSYRTKNTTIEASSDPPAAAASGET